MNEKESKVYIKQPRGALAVKPTPIILTLNLNIQNLLELQDKYTTLQCECKRFADWVLNLSHDCHSVAIHFDDEYIDLAARKIAENLRPKTAEEKEAERKCSVTR